MPILGVCSIISSQQGNLRTHLYCLCVMMADNGTEGVGEYAVPALFNICNLNTPTTLKRTLS